MNTETCRYLLYDNNVARALLREDMSESYRVLANSCVSELLRIRGQDGLKILQAITAAGFLEVIGVNQRCLLDNENEPLFAVPRSLSMAEQVEEAFFTRARYLSEKIKVHPKVPGATNCGNKETEQSNGVGFGY